MTPGQIADDIVRQFNPFNPRTMSILETIAAAIAAERAGWATREAAYLAACRAALEYDAGICGQAARGEVDLRDAGGGVATGEELDALYGRWQELARKALEG